MYIQNMLSRRSFLAVAAASAGALQAQTRKRVPVGVLVYAVIEDWQKDVNDTITALGNMGIEGLEITNYANWTPAKAKEVRALMDSLKLKCFATHTEPVLLVPGDKMKAMLELNHILGTQTISCVRGLTAAAMPASNNPDNAPQGGGRGAKQGEGKQAAAKMGNEPAIGYHPKSKNEAEGWK